MTSKLTDAQKQRLLKKIKQDSFMEQTKKAQLKGYKTKSGNQVAPQEYKKLMKVKRKAKKK